MIRRRYRAWAGDRGEVTTTVLMVPVVLVAVVLVVQFALAYHARQVLSGAAQDGAAAGARAGSEPGEGATLTRSLIDASAGSWLTGTTVDTASDGATVTVRASGEVASVLPFLGRITVRAQASATREVFGAQGGQP